MVVSGKFGFGQFSFRLVSKPKTANSTCTPQFFMPETRWRPLATQIESVFVWVVPSRSFPSGAGLVWTALTMTMFGVVLDVCNCFFFKISNNIYI